MAEEFDGGIQDETNEDLEIQGFIDTGVDSARVLVESSSTIMSTVSAKFDLMAKLMAEMAVFAKDEILKEHVHVHQFHKHRSCRGHCNESELIEKLPLAAGMNVSSGGKFFAAGRRNTLVNLLMSEMTYRKDLDDNGKIFYHDFVFEWDDPKLPPGVKQLQNNPFMPGNTLFPHKDPDYVVGFDEMLIDYYEDASLTEIRKPKMLKRKKPCIVITWDEYYSAIPEYHKEYLVI